MFVAFAKKAWRMYPDFITQTSSNIVWAFATARRWDASLSVVLARLAERHVKELKAQHVANMAWSFGCRLQGPSVNLIPAASTIAMAEGFARKVYKQDKKGMIMIRPYVILA